MFHDVLRITEKEFRILRSEVRKDLLICLKIIKRLAVIFGFILAPWIPAYVVQKTLVDEHQSQLDQYLNKTLGSLSGYTDTLFTLGQLCEEYKSTPDTELVQNRFYSRFDHYMAESIKWRAHFSADSATIKNYLGPRVSQLTSDFMFMTAYYGFTPQAYCSRPQLDVKTLICKEREIQAASIRYRPSLRDEVPADQSTNALKDVNFKNEKGAIVCPSDTQVLNTTTNSSFVFSFHQIT